MTKELQTLTPREQETLRHVRNRLMTGQPTSLRLLMADLGYASPRSVNLLVDALIDKGLLRRTAQGSLALCSAASGERGITVSIPLFETADLGLSGLLPSESAFDVSISTALTPAPHTYFLIRAHDQGLVDAAPGELALIRRQTTAAPGEIVLALVDKQPLLRSWHPSAGAIILKASASGCPPIVLPTDFQPLGVLVQILPAEVLAA